MIRRSDTPNQKIKYISGHNSQQIGNKIAFLCNKNSSAIINPEKILREDNFRIKAKCYSEDIRLFLLNESHYFDNGFYREIYSCRGENDCQNVFNAILKKLDVEEKDLPYVLNKKVVVDPSIAKMADDEKILQESKGGIISGVLYGVNSYIIKNNGSLEFRFNIALRDAGYEIIQDNDGKSQECFYHFGPQGLAAIVLCKKQHAPVTDISSVTMHTYPKYKSATIDIFMPHDSEGAQKFYRAFKGFIGSKKAGSLTIDDIFNMKKPKLQ